MKILWKENDISTPLDILMKKVKLMCCFLRAKTSVCSNPQVWHHQQEVLWQIHTSTRQPWLCPILKYWCTKALRKHTLCAYLIYRKEQIKNSPLHISPCAIGWKHTPVTIYSKAAKDRIHGFHGGDGVDKSSRKLTKMTIKQLTIGSKLINEFLRGNNPKGWEISGSTRGN